MGIRYPWVTHEFLGNIHLVIFLSSLLDCVLKIFYKYCSLIYMIYTVISTWYTLAVYEMDFCSSIFHFWFQDSLVANLLRLIQKMKPKEKKEIKKEEVDSETVQSDIDIKKKLFPGLAMANDPKVRVSVNAVLL